MCHESPFLTAKVRQNGSVYLPQRGNSSPQTWFPANDFKLKSPQTTFIMSFQKILPGGKEDIAREKKIAVLFCLLMFLLFDIFLTFSANQKSFLLSH